MIVNVTSGLFVMPFVAAAFILVWALSRTRLAPRPILAVRPSSLEVLLACLLILLSMVFNWLVYSTFADFWNTFPEPYMTGMLTLDTLVYETFFVLLPVLLVVRFLGVGFKSIRLTSANWRFSMVLGVSASLTTFVPSVIAAPELMGVLSGVGWFGYVTLVVAAFSEEVMFRGFLQTRLEGVVGAGGGVFLAALVFELWHFPSLVLGGGMAIGIFWLHVALFMLRGLLFGYIAWRSNSLLGSTVFHAFYNLPILVLA